jgi:hypothetical protein
MRVLPFLILGGNRKWIGRNACPSDATICRSHIGFDLLQPYLNTINFGRKYLILGRGGQGEMNKGKF